MQRTILLLFALFIAMSFGALTAQPAQNQRSLVLILDASGSMWEQIQGGHKITIARQVLKDLVTGERASSIKLNSTVARCALAQFRVALSLMPQ